FPHADHYRPKATDLLFDRHRARWPGMRFSDSSVIDKEKPLALGVFESERLPPVFDDDAAVGQPLVCQTLRPPLQCRGSTDPKSGPNDALRAAQFGSSSPVKKGQISAGAPFPICVKEMIRGNIVLIHGLLYKAHSEHIRVKCAVGPGIRRDRRQMMDALKLHPSKLHHPLNIARAFDTANSLPGASAEGRQRHSVRRLGANFRPDCRLPLGSRTSVVYPRGRKSSNGPSPHLRPSLQPVSAACSP